MGCNDALGNLENISVLNCTFSGNGDNDIRISLETSGNSAIAQDITIRGNTGGSGATGAFVRIFSIGDEAFTRRCQRITVDSNTLTGSGDFAISLEGVDDAIVRDNVLTNVGQAASTTNNAIQISGCADAIVEGNTVDGVEGAGTSDGHCIILDFASGNTANVCTDCIVRNNVLKGADKTGSKAAGISVWRATGSLIYGNEISACRYGVLVSNANSTGTLIYNNGVSVTVAAILADNSAAASTAKNNALVTAGTYAVVREGGSTLPTLTHNMYSGYSGTQPIDDAGTPTAADSDSYITDPKLDTKLRTLIPSPGYRLGTYITGFHDTYDDQNGNPFLNLPSIGLQFFTAQQRLRINAMLALDGLGITGTNVIDSRVYPSDDTQLPGLSIYTLDEELFDEPTLDDRQMREIPLVVEARVKRVANYNDYLDQIEAEVSKALYGMSQATVMHKSIDFQGRETELSDEGEQPMAMCALTYRFLYHVDATDPSKVLT